MALGRSRIVRSTCLAAIWWLGVAAPSALPAAVAKRVVAKPAAVAKRVVAKPAAVAKRAVAKPAAVAKRAVAKPAAVAKRAAAKPAAAKGDKQPPAAPVAGGPVKTDGDRLAIMAVQSDAARRIAAWVVAASDNDGRPYAVIDKPTASLLLFNGKGLLVGQAPVLLGIGIGDDSTPGVGGKELNDIGPAERTTPAGRYVAKFGRAFGKQRVLWVDYANSVALHAVITTHKQERRVERLLSPSPEDNRISFGCINVGTQFYASQLSPLFRKAGGLVYITPDTRSLDDVFPRVRLLQYLTEKRPR